MVVANKEGTTPGNRRGSKSRTKAGVRSVPLFKRSGSHFQSGDRQRGTEYFHEGRVSLEIAGTRARAAVKGTEQESYAVGIDWSQVAEKRILHTFCQCRRFADGRPCKHIWATLLAVAEAEDSDQPPGTDRLSVRKDRAANWADLGISVDEPSNDSAGGGRRRGRRSRSRRSPKPADLRPGATTWRSQIAALREQVTRSPQAVAADSSPGAELPDGLRFLVNTSASVKNGALVLDLFQNKPRTSGKNAKLTRAALEMKQVEGLLLPTTDDEPAPRPLTLVTVLPANPPAHGNRRRGRNTSQTNGVQRLQIGQELYYRALKNLCDAGLLGVWDGRSLTEQRSVSWDDGSPWHLALRLEVNAAGVARLQGDLERDDESLPVSEPALILPTAPPGGDQASPTLVFLPGKIATLEASRQHDLPWIELLRNEGEIVIPKTDLEEALTALLELPAMPPLEAPDEILLSEEISTPQPHLVLELDSTPEWMNPPLVAELSFDYGDLEVSAGDSRSSIVRWDKRSFLRRDMDAEHASLLRLLELGLQPAVSGQGHGLQLKPIDLPAVAEPLLAEGWTVEAHGVSLRPPSPPKLRVESGIDWFELSGGVDFEGDRVELAKVLEAISRGDSFIELDDGSRGLLPARWVETYSSLADLAQDSSENGLRFLSSQALFVDALLVAMPPPDVDGAFQKLRDKLQSFDRIKSKKESRGFGGELRGYQRHGLGWLTFLRDFGLGGILADDMGLGKTVQVLALMQTIRTPSKTTGLPSLVVAPRSLVYNWIDEAAHFTPKLKVVEYSGSEREALKEKLGDFDVVVTTYGTMRRDIGFLAGVEFDTVVLDEAQAIKNPASLTAKASGLLVARHRLALTGTPIENHLGELGSIFEFLNPGLLGRLSKLDVLASGRAPSQSELEVISQGIRPFILRRKKAEVLPDLPDKTEQVLLCDLREPQRLLYDQVRAGYQESLLKQVEEQGVGRSSIQVLEALLRLRQIACHPGLVNPDWEEAGSAKLEALFEQVSEVLEEGHKVLVFSQFTKLLAYVRQHLEEQGIDHAYLDGKTRDRGEVVERFQTDPECNLFLISLKAGGVGLNLTAAGYVFLLDPWWNPAVEAQAIDRTHRIGQTQPVFAYRMIARDTVEEKIVELQRSKKQLAETILDGGAGQPLRDLTAEDLRILLS